MAFYRILKILLLFLLYFKLVLSKIYGVIKKTITDAQET